MRSASNHPQISRLTLALALAAGLVACTEPVDPKPAADPDPRPETAPAAPAAAPAPARTGPPTLRALGNATYRGIGQFEAVELSDGRWEGPPFVEGTATRPLVTLAGNLRLTGDLTGDDREEAAVLVHLNAGGTGDFLYLAVFANAAGVPENLGTVLVGDRVQVVSALVDGDQVRLTVVRPGPGDPACCPGEVALLAWQWVPDVGLTELSVEAPTERLSLDLLGTGEWTLVDWGSEAPAAEDPAVTLGYAEGRFGGSSGCNRYFAGVIAGERPGEIRLEKIGATRMACAEQAMLVEQRFLTQLEATVSFGFDATRLALGYQSDGRYATMLFAQRPSDD